MLSAPARPAERTVRAILDPHRFPAKVATPDLPPFCAVNEPGKPRAALPTLVATLGSYAFRDGGPGMVWDTQLNARQGGWAEPNPDERERAMGYETGATAAPGVTLAERHAITGSAMDAFAMQALFASAWALDRAGHSTLPSHPELVTAAAGAVLGGGAPPQAELFSPAPAAGVEPDPVLLHDIAAATDPVQDIHEDSATLHYLQHRHHQPHTDPAEQRRVLRRAANYSWSDEHLWRVMADGSRRLCAPPSMRPSLISEAHQAVGHYGAKRTLSMLAGRHWWQGMRLQVADHCRGCSDCARRNASFGVEPPTLNSLPIKGMMYRWGVDLFGPIDNQLSDHRYRYVMIAVEHFSKWAVAVPLPNKEASTVAQAFRQNVLGVYGAPAEIVTDQGNEFREEFAQLMVDSYIDHRVTSAYHPQANGLAERTVQTMKRALAKMVHADPDTWYKKLPYAVLGYNASVQQSTGLCPYQLMHAVPPTIPSSIRERFSAYLNLDDPVLAAQSVYQRSMALQQDVLMAGSNQAIAQHRDQLRYARTRAGGYTAKREQMQPGAYVYLSVNEPSALELHAHPEVLRVVEVKDSGVLTLQGQCGTLIDMHISACSPCHVPVEDAHVYPTLARPPADMACEVCMMANSEATMLLCDECGTGWHMRCLNPPLSAIPPGAWVCPSCEAAGVSLNDVEVRNAAVPALAPVNDYVRQSLGPHMELDGKKIYQLWRHSEPGAKARLRWHAGTATYLGHRGRFAWFRVDYDDGDSCIISMANLRAIIARMPSEPPIITPEPTLAPVPAPAPVPALPTRSPASPPPPPPAAAVAQPSGKRALSVRWAPGIVEPASSAAGTLRRSARQEKAARALGVLTKESLQDVRVAAIYFM